MAKRKLSEEQAKLLADNIMPAFIPKNADAESFSFHFTAEGTNYRAEYVREKKDWKQVGVAEVVEGD